MVGGGINKFWKGLQILKVSHETPCEIMKETLHLDGLGPRDYRMVILTTLFCVG